MSLGKAPEPFVDFCHSIFWDLKSLLGDCSFRLLKKGTEEAGLWIANTGFDITKTEIGKMSATLSPIINTVHLTIAGTYIRIPFNATIFNAVSYTSGLKYVHHVLSCEDVLTGDDLFVWEFEIAAYGQHTGYVSLEKTEEMRLQRGYGYDEATFAAHKALCYFKEGVPRARYRSTLLNLDLIAKIVAVSTMAYRDDRIFVDLAEAWDSFFSEHRPSLAVPPNYVKKREIAERIGCPSSNLPARVEDDLDFQLKYFYRITRFDIYGSLFDKIMRYVHEICNMYPSTKEKINPSTITPRGRSWLLAQEIYSLYPYAFSDVNEAFAFVRWYPKPITRMDVNMYVTCKHLPTTIPERDTSVLLE